MNLVHMFFFYNYILIKCVMDLNRLYAARIYYRLYVDSRTVLLLSGTHGYSPSGSRWRTFVERPVRSTCPLVPGEASLFNARTTTEQLKARLNSIARAVINNNVLTSIKPPLILSIIEFHAVKKISFRYSNLASGF